jgi:hypothetical protein
MAGAAAAVVNAEVPGRAGVVRAGVLPGAALGLTAGCGSGQPVGRQGHLGQERAGCGGRRVGRHRAGIDAEERRGADGGFQRVELGIANSGRVLDCYFGFLPLFQKPTTKGPAAPRGAGPNEGLGLVERPLHCQETYSASK